GGEGNVRQEYLVWTKYVVNIPLFTEIPTQKKNSTSYTICLIGNTPLGSILIPSEGKQIKNRPLAIRRVENLSQLDNCQVLFIAASERYRLQQLLPAVHQMGIMTISDMRDFTKMGGIVSLVSVNNRITYDLNLVAARSAGISFSTQILKLANDVIN
ncbi:MAG: YfiR family protein, partial [Syntrophales bacterium LBB04]|nr:YfiR family protein [Syntrophales bacterium LBB04]